jgi:hypothetical protein
LLLNLGLAYQTRFNQSGERQDAIRAIAAWQEATDQPTIRAGMRVGTARNWADLATRIGDPTAAVAGYEAAIRLLPELRGAG